MSWQHKRFGTVFVTVSDISLCDSRLALYYYTAHVPRAHTVLASLMPRPRPCPVNRGILPNCLTDIATFVDLCIPPDSFRDSMAEDQ